MGVAVANGEASEGCAHRSASVVRSSCQRHPGGLDGLGEASYAPRTERMATMVQLMESEAQKLPGGGPCANAMWLTGPKCPLSICQYSSCDTGWMFT